MDITVAQASIFVAMLSLIGTILGLVITSGKESKKDAVAKEHRLTVMEGNQFTKEDRLCLAESLLNTRFLMRIIESEAARALKNPLHLDGVLNDIQLNGLAPTMKALKPSVKTDFISYLVKAAGGRSKNKAEKARMLLGMIKLQEEQT